VRKTRCPCRQAGGTVMRFTRVNPWPEPHNIIPVAVCPDCQSNLNVVGVYLDDLGNLLSSPNVIWLAVCALYPSAHRYAITEGA